MAKTLETHSPTGAAENSNTRQHRMPFGAELRQDGNVCFRLWAPAAKEVDVSLTFDKSHGTNTSGNQTSTSIPMDAEPDGWFSVTTNGANVGTQYRFCINGDKHVPDPASRFQPEDVHGPSEVINPCDFYWHDSTWRGRPWEEAIIYELHVGTFTPEGTFAGVQQKLDYLVDLGVTAIELMPVADFPGARNWGYDGTYLFAPENHYGRPEDLKALIDAAHARGLMVFLDVVYNHFGPEGNFLHLYSPQFFKPRCHTPWGAAINFDGKHSYWVRQFFIHNALFWLDEYHFDGLRLDAVHALVDDSKLDILTELADCVYNTFGEQRHIHLMLENDHNASHYLTRDERHYPKKYVAQWNDDIHHAIHVLLTKEENNYYQDYTDDPMQYLGRCLAEGFAYQGERSAYRGNTPRGESSAHLPATAFVSFLQNHDQVGNRAFGDRINSLISPEQYRAALVLLLLAPSPPLLFMAQEWGSFQPFPFFCDFERGLTRKVIAGRNSQFKKQSIKKAIPNPADVDTFLQAVINWQDCNQPQHNQWLELHRELLKLRKSEVIPRLKSMKGNQKAFNRLSHNALSASWFLGDGSELVVVANLGDEAITKVDLPCKPVLYATHNEKTRQTCDNRLSPWSVVWYLDKKLQAFG